MRKVFAILLFVWVASLSGRTLAVSLAPYVEMAEALAGPEWEVVVALPKGGDHESYAPTPGHMRRLFQAEIFWASGMGFERLLLPKLQQARKSLRVVQSEAICLEDSHGHAGHEHHHDHDDLHRWLDPALIMADAVQLTEALVAMDPANTREYQTRKAKFKERCRHLSAEIEEMLKPHAGEPIFVYHAAFERFADAFGLEQVALERNGREPSLRELTGLIERARAANAKVVYVQPQHRRSSAEAVARALHARLEEVDPMAADWADNLLRMARQFAEDLSARKERE